MTECKKLHSDQWAALTAVRDIAAFYVLISHSWFQVWPAASPPFGYSTMPTGIWYNLTSWLYFGHYAVVVFIVLSGFSLAGSVNLLLKKQEVLFFYKRRFLRIAPPYYVALFLSIIIILITGEQKTDSQWDISIPLTGRGIISHFLLFQDVFDSSQINYALWSVALEFHLYLLFPLFVFMCTTIRWWSIILVYTSIYIVIYLLERGSETPSLAAYLGFIAHFYAGIWAYKIKGNLFFERNISLFNGITFFNFIMLFALSVHYGFYFFEKYMAYFDLLCTVSTLSLIICIVNKSDVSDRLRKSYYIQVGEYSYSLYLIHAPILFVIWTGLNLMKLSQPVTWILLTLISIPICLFISQLFYLRFERPFIRHISGKDK